jgi:hypothetical protein
MNTPTGHWRRSVLHAVTEHLVMSPRAAAGDVDTSHAPSLERHGSRTPVDPAIPQIIPAMTNEALRAQFEVEGCIHIKGLFTAAEAKQMEAELVHFIDDVLPTSTVGAYYHDAADPSTVFQIDTMADEPYFDTLMNGGRGQSKVNDVVEVRGSATGIYLLPAKLSTCREWLSTERAQSS